MTDIVESHAVFYFHAVLLFYNSLFLSPLDHIEYQVCYNGVYNPLRPSGFQKNTNSFISLVGLVRAGSLDIGRTSSFTVIRTGTTQNKSEKTVYLQKGSRIKVSLYR